MPQSILYVRITIYFVQRKIMTTSKARLLTAITDSGRHVIQDYTAGAVHIDGSPFIISITPSDATTYDPPLMGIRVGGTAGDVVVVSNGNTVTISGVNQAEIIPGNITQVKATGTTATGIIGWER